MNTVILSAVSDNQSSNLNVLFPIIIMGVLVYGYVLFNKTKYFAGNINSSVLIALICKGIGIVLIGFTLLLLVLSLSELSAVLAIASLIGCFASGFLLIGVGEIIILLDRKI